MQDLFEFCRARKERSDLLWRPTDDLQAIAANGRLELATDFVPPQESGAPGTQGGPRLLEGDLGHAAVYTARRPISTPR